MPRTAKPWREALRSRQERAKEAHKKIYGKCEREGDGDDTDKMGERWSTR